jgi:hypothetical protein
VDNYIKVAWRDTLGRLQESVFTFNTKDATSVTNAKSNGYLVLDTLQSAGKKPMISVYKKCAGTESIREIGEGL